MQTLVESSRQNSALQLQIRQQLQLDPPDLSVLCRGCFESLDFSELHYLVSERLTNTEVQVWHLA